MPTMTDTTLVPHQENSLTFFLSLISGKVKPGKLWYDPEYRIKYLFRSLAWPVATHKMLTAITEEPVMREVLPIQHTLPSKIHRPYLYNGMPMAARTHAIISHYQYVKQLSSLRLRQAMLTQQGVELVNFAGKNGETFTVTLACTGRCEREGEVNLLFRRDGVQLAMLTFAVTTVDGEKVAMIGGIQGAHRDTPHELIREATKACYGLFPKRLLMETLSLICAETGVTKIEAVSDNGHIFRSLRYRLKKRSLFHASYNEFWETLNAQPSGNKLYSLPLSFPRKPLEEIASKKRSEYRKRYDLLDTLREQFSQVIA
jgi:uncharacterized protein VirK/YbjX